MVRSSLPSGALVRRVVCAKGLEAASSSRCASYTATTPISSPMPRYVFSSRPTHCAIDMATDSKRILRCVVRREVRGCREVHSWDLYGGGVLMSGGGVRRRWDVEAGCGRVMWCWEGWTWGGRMDLGVGCKRRCRPPSAAARKAAYGSTYHGPTDHGCTSPAARRA